MRLLFARPDVSLSAADIAEQDAGYTKRAVHTALEDLALAGLLELTWQGNRKTYRLARPDELAALCGLTPLQHVRWVPLLDTLAGLSALFASEPATDVLALRSAARGLDTSVAAAGSPPVPHHVRGDAFAEAFQDWALALLTDLAAGQVATARQVKRPLT